MGHKFYLLLLNTESGDEFQWAFTRRPTTDEVYKLFQRDIPDELGDPDDDLWGTAESWRIHEIDVEDI